MKKMFLMVAMVLSLTLVAAASSLAFDNVTPSDAYALATSSPDFYIVDVRTLAEWQWVGHPGKNKAGEGAALEGKVVNISSMIEKKGVLIDNKRFLKDVEDLFEDKCDAVLILMCRSGGRSAAAAALLEAKGYNVLNMTTGFEGGTDANGYRTRNGWKVDGLPYTFAGEGYAK
jgi:rhodanese-related sulfurtransferase